MTLRLKLATAALTTLAPVAAQAMSVAEFLVKADGLKAKGMMAMMSPDIKVLGSEMKGVGAAYRADVTAARAAGRTDFGCPPPKGKARMDGKELVAAFRAIPPAQQATTSVKQAFYNLMRMRFPCRA